jgi:hypothetical protein
MLGFIGKWASSKGMGIIPNLEGLSINEARTAIANAGFNLGNETSLGNSGGATSINNGKAKGRIDSGQLLAYESVLDFEYYSYVQVTTTTQAPTTTQPPVTTSPPVTDPPPPVTTTTTTSPVVTTTTTTNAVVTTTTTTSTPTLYYGYCALNGTPVGPLATTATCAQAYAAQENANGYPPIGWVCGPTPADGTPSCGTTTTTAAPTFCRNEVRSVSSGTCPSSLATYNVCYSNSNFTGEVSATFVSCFAAATTTTTTQAATTTTTVNTSPNWVASYNEYSGACCTTVTYYLDTNSNSPTYNTYSHRSCLSAGGSQCSSTTTTTTTKAATTTTTTTAAPTTTWYCSTRYSDGSTDRGTTTSDVSSELCGDYKTVCTVGGYPAYPSVPACGGGGGGGGSATPEPTSGGGGGGGGGSATPEPTSGGGGGGCTPDGTITYGGTGPCCVNPSCGCVSMYNSCGAFVGCECT